MATESKKRMRESKGAGLARLVAVGLRGTGVVASTFAELFRLIEKASLRMAEVLMETVALEDK